MNTNEIVRDMTLSQYKDIIATVVTSVPEDLTFDEAKNITGAKRALVLRITEAILACAGRYSGSQQAETVPSPAILRLISGGKQVMIPACKGTRTIAKSASVFTGYLDPAFGKLNTQGAATSATDADVYELAQNAKFSEMFGSLSTDLDRLVFTEDIVVTFCEKNYDWLSKTGGTFFLLKEGDQFFVAHVDVSDRGLLRVCRFDFERGLVWYAAHRLRVVVPQLKKLGN